MENGETLRNCCSGAQGVREMRSCMSGLPSMGVSVYPWAVA